MSGRRGHLLDAQLPEPAQQSGHRAERAPGHEQARARRETGQRGKVQVVGVQMGDDRQVRAPGPGLRHRAPTAP